MKPKLLIALAFCAAAMHAPAAGQVPERTRFLLPARTPFVAMLGEARMEVQCRNGCPARPIIYDPAEVPSDPYSREFRRAIYRFLLDVSGRPQVIDDFTESDRSLFEVSLNVLDRYWACLEERFAAGDASDYADAPAVDRLAARASLACKDKRDSGLRAIPFDGPDFVTFDPLADADKPRADVSELLQQVQEFAVAYYAGRRGVRWTYAVALQMLPEPVTAREGKPEGD